MSVRKHKKQQEVGEKKRLRLDKWLWAARFFRTRGQAKQAIDGGRVEYRGNKTKPASEIILGSVLVIRQGFDKREVVVKALSDKRRGATEAALLYEETEASLRIREAEAAQQKMWKTGIKPNKKDRRMIAKFKNTVKNAE